MYKERALAALTRHGDVLREDSAGTDNRDARNIMDAATMEIEQATNTPVAFARRLGASAAGLGSSTVRGADRMKVAIHHDCQSLRLILDRLARSGSDCA